MFWRIVRRDRKRVFVRNFGKHVLLDVFRLEKLIDYLFSRYKNTRIHILQESFCHLPLYGFYHREGDETRKRRLLEMNGENVIYIILILLGLLIIGVRLAIDFKILLLL